MTVAPDSLRLPLPIDEHLPSILSALEARRAVVVKAPPGAGKSTRVPGAVLDSGLLGAGSLVMLEPRRVAARACAAAISSLRGDEVGGQVGYKIRLDERSSPRTRIMVVTEGILTRRMLSDPFLEGISCVVLDEFHERSVHADLAIAFVKELMQVREDLMLVVMSATVDTTAVSAYLGDAPVVEAATRQHPIDVTHAPSPDDRPLHVRIAAAVTSTLRRQSEGDLLVFLPGAREISLAGEILSQRSLPGSPVVLPMYGALGADAQDRVLSPSRERRVVLATNIAETSLTIPGVTAVVDSGLARTPEWDPARGLGATRTIEISRQSATQRAGRAGRTAPGIAFRMWTKESHFARPKAEAPRIRKTDPAEVLLQVLAFHPGDPRDFDFLEPPTPGAMEAGLALLDRLGALADDPVSLSPLGKSLARLPLHPRLGKILLTAPEPHLRRAACLAAILADIDAFDRRHGIRGSEAHGARDCDIGWRADLLEVTFDPSMEKEIGRLLAMGSRGGGAIDEAGDPLSDGGLLLPGYPDRVCRRRAAGSPRGKMGKTSGVRLSEGSGVRQGDLFIALRARAPRGKRNPDAMVDLASRIELADLKRAFPDLIDTTVEAIFDEESGRVFGEEQLLFGDLVIGRKPARCDQKIVAQLLAIEATARFDTLFKPSQSAATLMDRIRFTSGLLPDHEWPDVSLDGIRRLLPEVCLTARSLAEIERADWGEIVAGTLDWRARKALDEAAPIRIAVPSGREIAIDYSPAARGEAPVLPVKLQEVFGMADTPRIGLGRVPLVMHLLAPNGRPAQVTSDLTSFWENTYPEVRKELRARYPKHPWPKNPHTAQPTSGTVKRGRR